jgi:hypothetical protein
MYLDKTEAKLLNYDKMFKRNVTTNGSISLDNRHYQVGRRYALKRAAVHLDGINKLFHVTVGSERLASHEIRGLQHKLMDFDDYAELIISEARAIARGQS